jgi:predicted nuclease of restriction endonuclease-like (RecB) superfamily
VTSILDQARSNVVRSVNTNMVLAYWMIGREILLELQGGEARAKYGKRLVESLLQQLTERFGAGFSEQSLQNFRRFYQVFPERIDFSSPSGRESDGAGSECQIHSLPGSELVCDFSLQLSWSHYRALMRVSDEKARTFYEQEAIECGWSKAQLERQIQSSYYQRIIANHGESALTDINRQQLSGEPVAVDKLIKSPYVLEFLGLPDSANLHENSLEQAVIDNLQSFLLELGKGFSFVARQKHLRIDDDDFYVDLVFYN